MRALVLGGSGFIGCHVVRALLNEEIEVRVLTRSTTPSLALEEVEHERVQGDLEDLPSLKKALKDCEALFHVAGYYPIYSLNRRAQKQRAQRQMENVLQAATQASSLKKMVYTSSLSTLGIPPSGLAREETPYLEKDHRGLYYQIKYEMEQKVFRAAESGLPVTVVNPTAVFGDCDIKPTSGIFIINIAKERWPFIVDAKMNAVDVVDVAQAQVSALKKGKVGERYILGGHNTSVWEMSQLIAKIAHSKPPQFKIPLFMGSPMAYVSEVISKHLLKKKIPPIPQVGIDFLKHGGHYDSSKAIRELNLHTTPLEKTLARAIHWFQQHQYL